MARGWIWRILGRASRGVAGPVPVGPVSERVPVAPGLRVAPDVRGPVAAGLGRFAGQCDRIVVVDTETTGVYRSDRVVEVGLVSLGLDGRVLDEWDSLVNPGRDVGPTWLHGITAEMVAGAPEFGDVAGEIAGRLHGAVVCAHNLPFDVRMLGHEFERVGVGWEPARGLDTLAVTHTRLGVACAERGIAVGGGHRALVDARAVAMLLQQVAGEFGDVEAARFMSAVPAGGRGPVSRSDGSSMVVAPPTYLAALASQVVHRVDAAAVASYLEVLDRAMADLRLDDDERGELAEFAAAVGLHETERAQAHRRWVLDMADAARADGVVDGDEYDQLLRAAHGLGVDIGVVDAAVRGERQQRVRVELRPGTRVCFTGEATDASGQLIEREVLERAARDVGLVAEEKMTKSRCDLLVTAEFGSASTKMDQARNWAKPVTDVASFLGALDALRRSVPTRVDAVVDGAVRRVGTCVHCGAPFTYDGKARAVPVCATCTTTPAVGVERIVSDSLPIVQRSAGEAPTMETLLCSVCGRTFTRARTRGRKPTRCPNC